MELAALYSKFDLMSVRARVEESTLNDVHKKGILYEIVIEVKTVVEQLVKANYNEP